MKQGWTYKKLGDICKLYQPHTISSKEMVDDGKYDVFGANGIIGKYNQYNHEEPEILMTCRGATCGNINVSTPKSWINGNAMVVHIKDEKTLNKSFLIYILSHIDKTHIITGAAQPQITRQTLSPLMIGYPTLSEQERIVERLDAAFAQIDELKSNAEKQLAEARALFQSALTQAMQPKPGWQEIAFKDICSFVRGPFGGSLKKECFKESGYAVYEQQNAIYNKFSFRYFIDEEKYESMKRFSVNPGDLIMSCSGTIGKVAIIPDDAKQGIINQALLKLTPSKKINKYYLKYLMESELFKELIRSYSDGAAIQNIASVSILKEILLRIPSVSEQQRIVEYNDSLTASFNEIEDNYKQTVAECDAMKQALLRQIFE